ncbi:MAG: hypothetical protein M1536_00400 [Firmicutes bacterium]|nr:hypothetical protein [Bacillota bacterium]
MKVKTSAPTRIDLAGGTLDIYPLYIFLGGGTTVNLAINLRSYVEIEERDDDKILINSTDLNEKLEAKNIETLKPGGPLDLIARAIKFYHPKTGLTVMTKNTAPRGSGLGASSSLLMALSAALNKVADTYADLDELIHWGANIEARSLKIPTGKQDYYAAVYGGLNAIQFHEKGVEFIKVYKDEKDLGFLSDHFILSFTGISHFSGTNNWNMMKRFIDGDPQTVRNLHLIKETAVKMEEALLSRDIEKIASVLKEEWENRKGLAEGVSTPETEKIMASAHKAGAIASKLCGAGGGGCMITIADPEKREQVCAALLEAGAEILDFKADTTGIKLEAI